MKFAALHDLDLESFSRDAVRQLGALLRGSDRMERRGAAVSQIIDDPYSEAVNFRLDVNGISHRGLTTYDALRQRYETDDMREEPLALFVRHAREIGASAVAKQARERVALVVLEDGDL
ncbi:hypothetical protein [Candidatus Burkholderia verschuerenii]|uniref:hypothetical protein n=1 Tax=Candidatus Burkholderia verschuerenii TaxID=242163 RepID=UPI00067C72CE|nr:hypothetical protein [Candidatus Burkholderia verschuerenii]